jgi:PAS domain S-box-containing protein
MLYSSISCNVSNTLKKFQELDLDKMIETDYFGFITITKYKKIKIDGEILFKDINSDLIIELLMEKCDEIYELEKSCIYDFENEHNNTSIIVAPVREQEHYKVFSICCKFNKKYNDRDLSIIKFITQVYYENVLLDSEIIKERDYLQNLFNSTQSFIIGMDINGIITSVNKGTHKILGWSVESVIGKSYQVVIPEEYMQIIENLIDDVIIENKSCSRDELIFLHSNQNKVIVNLTISPMHNYVGEVTGVVIIGSDITKRKIYERELEQLRQFAMIGELVAGAAHDIRNPLMSIRGCSRILERNLSHNPEQLEFIEPIINQVDRLDEVIEQMLSYSFIIKEELYSYIDINEVLKKCYNVISLHKKLKFITINKMFSCDLPLIKCNNVQLQQALLNILFNAVQAIDSEGIINIKSSKLSDEKKVLVCISDNGKGIDISDINEIFNPLYTTKDKNTGIGLAIVKRVIDKQGGEIIVNSKANVGTEFEIYLPY